MCGFGVKRLSVDCTTDHYAQVRNQKNRHSFLASLSMLVEDYQLDGIDYNWEYPGYRLNIKIKQKLTKSHVQDGSWLLGR